MEEKFGQMPRSLVLQRVEGNWFDLNQFFKFFNCFSKINQNSKKVPDEISTIFLLEHKKGDVLFAKYHISEKYDLR